MKAFKSIVLFLAVFYVLLSIVQVLFLPYGFVDSLDNWFFVVGFLFTLYLSFIDKKSRMIFFSFSLLFIWTFVSQIQNGIDNLFHNLNYHFIFIKWAVILIVSMHTLEDKKLSKFIAPTINTIFLILVGLNLLIAINPQGLGELLQHNYTSSNYSDFVFFNEPGSFRLAGTQLNPNDNALIFGCFILYFFQEIKRNWVFVLIAIGILVLTQSRTIVLILIFIGLYILVKNGWNKITLKKIMVLFLPILLLGILLFFNSNYLVSLFNGDAFVSNSFLSRIENYNFLTSFSLKDLIVGKGVLQNTPDTFGFYFDSEYLGIIFQFGIIGLICWLLIIITFLKISKNIFIRLFLVLILFTSFTNFTFLNLQTAVIISFFLGIMLGKRNELLCLGKDLLTDK